MASTDLVLVKGFPKSIPWERWSCSDVIHLWSRPTVQMHLVSKSSWVSPTHGNSAMQALTNISYTTSVQHKEVSHERR